MPAEEVFGAVLSLTGPPKASPPKPKPPSWSASLMRQELVLLAAYTCRNMIQGVSGTDRHILYGFLEYFGLVDDPALFSNTLA